MKNISTNIKKLALFSGALYTLGTGRVSAQIDEVERGVKAVDPSGGTQASFTDIFQDIVNLMLFIVGAISVIMLIVGGIRYVVSGGDQQAITDAKNTILYAIIGLVIAALAFTIVGFVIDQLQ